MPGRSKRNRRIINNSTIQNPVAQATPQASSKTRPAVAQPYESYKYLKNDLKWSGITAGIIAVVIIICYIWLH